MSPPGRDGDGDSDSGVISNLRMETPFLHCFIHVERWYVFYILA